MLQACTIPDLYLKLQKRMTSEVAFTSISGCASPSAIRPLEAVTHVVILTAIYVGALFLPFNSGDRNAPSVIRARLASSCTVALLSETYLYFRIPSQPAPNEYRCFVPHFAIGVVLTSFFYSGPIIAQATAPKFSAKPPFVAQSDQLVRLRDIVFAPLSEELVFRRHALLCWSCLPFSARLFGPAAVFAFAHLHHVKTIGLAGTLVQLSYTFVFGVYAASLFLATGGKSIAAPLAAHMFCNWFGLPDFAAVAEHHRWRFVSLIYASCVIGCLCILAFFPGQLLMCA